MKKIILLFVTAILFSCNNKQVAKKQRLTVNKQDSIAIKKMFNTVLSNGKCYGWLDELANGIGGRLSGSKEAEKAVKWAEKLLKSQQFDSVWLQPVMVPHWVRGEKEIAYFMDKGQKITVPICALGGSVATPKQGITASVVEVNSIEEMKKLGVKVKGKIVFYNGHFDDTIIDTFEGYGGCVSQRYSGARVAGEYGALAVIVRSITNSVDDFPHTGGMGYGNIAENQKIPAAAISTKGANLLSETLKKNPDLSFYFKQSCQTLPDAPSFNVIAELKGTTYPNKYIIVSGHLDSWDLGDGAHDDGAGVAQSIEVLRLFKETGIKPKHTLRCVLYMNEENGLKGGLKYAKEAERKGENHIAAIEADAGGHTPRGFTFDANKVSAEMIQQWKPLLAPYGLQDIYRGYPGADIKPLHNSTISLLGYMPDSQRYFDYHHCANDTFDKINKRELELGAGAMAAMIYLLDKYNR
ncbi:MAG: M20/M25/M40 family metallo-hydrolase [Flavobacteriaceae bacterium]|nr:M20/M25/M40 family metallo-hydrolase [Flavobacteriaceae bacterium]